MKRYRFKCLCAASIFCLFLGIATARGAEGATPPSTYATRLPYSFSNFVWWDDGQLRELLKKRIPGLGDEIAPMSEIEGKMRDSLKALLKDKGIDAEVQSMEPSNSSFHPPMVNLLGVDDLDFPRNVPSIVFSVLTPRVVFGHLTIQSDADDFMDEIEKEVQSSEGKEFQIDASRFMTWRLEEIAKRHAHLDARVQFEHSAPYKKQDAYAVDVTVEVKAGPRYTVSSIAVDGGPLFQGRDLTQLIHVRQGDLAVGSPFMQLGPQLRDYYRQNGFADVRVVTTPTEDREHSTVSYVLKVISGPPYHLRSLTIEKLSAEQEHLVRELLGMKPGDLYREDFITGLYRKISDEPKLKGYGFSFSPKADKASAEVDLSLSFFQK